jgi:phage gp46-like protein
MADIFLKKIDTETDLYFDAVVEGNDLTRDDTILTAVILSIFTDGSKPYIGNQINGNIYGNKQYNISKLSDENIKKYENGLYECLQWLIDDNIVSAIVVTVTKVAPNVITVYIKLTLEGQNSTNVIYSLDERMEIIDDIN